MSCAVITADLLYGGKIFAKRPAAESDDHAHNAH